MASGGPDAIVQGQATDDHRAHLLYLEVLDHPGGAALGQVVIAGAVGVQVGLDAFPHEIVVVDGGRQAGQQLEAGRAGDTVADPGQVSVGQLQRLQHVRGVGDYPGGVGRVGVLAAQAQVGTQGHGIQISRDFVTLGDGQFLRHIAGEAVLGVDIETGDLHGGSPRWNGHIIHLVY